MIVKNNTNSDWTIGFLIPAGASITMDAKKHIALAKNHQAFLDARAKGDLLLEGSPAAETPESVASQESPAEPSAPAVAKKSAKAKQ
jgi:hypothetical protein